MGEIFPGKILIRFPDMQESQLFLPGQRDPQGVGKGGRIALGKIRGMQHLGVGYITHGWALWLSLP